MSKPPAKPAPDRKTPTGKVAATAAGPGAELPKTAAKAAAKAAATASAPVAVAAAPVSNRFTDRFAPARPNPRPEPLPMEALKPAAKVDPKVANAWKQKAGRDLTEAELLAMPEGEYMNDKQLDFFRVRLQQQKDDLLSNAGETTEHLREDTTIVPSRSPSSSVRPWMPLSATFSPPRRLRAFGRASRRPSCGGAKWGPGPTSRTAACAASPTPPPVRSPP